MPFWHSFCDHALELSFWQVFRAAIPNLALGNGFLLSHAPNVLGSARNIQALLQQSGLPEGLMQHLVIDHDQQQTLYNILIFQG